MGITITTTNLTNPVNRRLNILSVVDKEMKNYHAEGNEDENLMIKAISGLAYFYDR